MVQSVASACRTLLRTRVKLRGGVSVCNCMPPLYDRCRGAGNVLLTLFRPDTGLFKLQLAREHLAPAAAMSLRSDSTGC